MSLDITTGEIVDEVIPALTYDEARTLTDEINNDTLQASIKVAQAWQGQAWKPLGYKSWEEYADAELPLLGSNQANRHVLLVSLRNVGMSTRAIAAVTGLHPTTIGRHVSGAANAAPEVTGVDGKTYPSKITRRESVSETVEYETPHREGVDGDGESNAGDASDGDGVDSHDVEQLEPESTPVVPVGSAPTGGEVEAAADGDEVEGISTHPSGATSPKPFMSVPAVASAVRQALKLAKFDAGQIRQLNNPDLDFTIDSWIVSAEQFAAAWRASKPSHLRIVEGPE